MLSRTALEDNILACVSESETRLCRMRTRFDRLSERGIHNTLILLPLS